MRRITLFIISVVIFIPSLAYSEQPLDVIQVRIDQVIGLLKNPQYQEMAQRDIQRGKIWEVIQQVFDFNEMARRALARNWKKFTIQQRKEFSHLFSELLGNTYLDKIQRGYQDEKINYLAQEMVSDSKALVKTKVVRESMEIPVFYSMIKRNETWRVYDVNIEGVSLVKNYRAQFSKILLNRAPAQLIEMLKKKIERQEKERSGTEKTSYHSDRMALMARVSRVLGYNNPAHPMQP